MNAFTPPLQLAVTLLAISVLWFVEARASYWPLPVDRKRHAAVNLLLSALSVAMLGAATVGIVLVSEWARDRGFGLLNWLRLPLFFETIAGVLLYDLANYWIHRSQHMFPALWKIHRAHHTDVYIDVTSAFRFHPFETLYRAFCFTALVLFVGISPYSILVYGILAAIALPLSHANLAIPAYWEPWARYGVVLPLQHRIHHSQKRHEHDRNYGIVFLWWDHFFGTYLSPNEVSDLKVGIEGAGADRSGRLGPIIKEPFLS